ncbi:4Fe-4S double cluster binding domain-containing protein [Hydrogenoanaerobacterium sp.]|uniref:4Fe-4S double cluster binding domain-containing protein n=1 Tax=Hydrogenoanaerobacterium sp. TaxID=2953763 RepID=UPI0028A1B97D|nr:4Fe-4S double cluster binding domain-containing protein [Hydrogenoanaerobacterium sp.]
MSLQAELKQYLLQQGVSDVGFGQVLDEPKGFMGGCGHFVSLAVKLSDAIVDEITTEPTHTYFNHYRSVNAFLDQMLLKTGLFLDRAGYRYITVAASQSINKDGWNYDGRYSHKKAACLAGLGTIGKSSLFLHREYGSRVRLGTVFTDCAFETEQAKPVSVCGGCRLCVDACPSGAILGGEWQVGTARSEIFDPEKCSRHMKEKYKHIGRGAVCGVCMRVCPQACKRLQTVQKS